MKKDTPQEFGEYLKRLREKRGFSIRELARRSGLNDGGITRLERGRRTPQPETLKALAEALEVPLVDLFAKAGYVTPHDLPGMSTYLHLRYGDLPEEALTSIDEYLQRLIDKHGLDTDGPAGLEDEAARPSEK